MQNHSTLTAVLKYTIKQVIIELAKIVNQYDIAE